MAKNMLNLKELNDNVYRIEKGLVELKNNLGTLGDKVDILSRRVDNEIEAREKLHKPALKKPHTHKVPKKSVKWWWQ